MNFLKTLMFSICVTLLCGYMFYASYLNTDSDSYFMKKNSTNTLPQHVVRDEKKLARIPCSAFDHKRRSRNLWPDDENCKGLDVKFVKNFNVTFLASFPRSGNTWVRFLIEATTGVFTGSMYRDKEQRELGFYGENEPGRSGTTIVQKTHGNAFSPQQKAFKNPNEPVIVLVRNVERSITSYWSLRLSRARLKLKQPYTYTASERNYQTAEFHNFAKNQITVWTKFHEEVLTFCKNILVIFYEELVLDPIKETKRMVEFLGYEIEPERLFCLKKHPDGLAKKNDTAVIDVFTSKERQLSAAAMKIVLNLLENRGIEAPSEYTEYVERYQKE